MSKLEYLRFIPLIIFFTFGFWVSDASVSDFLPLLYSLLFLCFAFFFLFYFLIKYQTFWLHTKKNMYLGLPGHWSVLFLFSYFLFYSFFILALSFLIVTKLTNFSVSTNILAIILIYVILSVLFFRTIHNLATKSNEELEDDL